MELITDIAGKNTALSLAACH